MTHASMTHASVPREVDRCADGNPSMAQAVLLLGAKLERAARCINERLDHGSEFRFVHEWLEIQRRAPGRRHGLQLRSSLELFFDSLLEKLTR